MIISVEYKACLISAIRTNRISPIQTPFLMPLTPHSEAAKVLAKIGDEVKEKYERRLETAVQHLIIREEAAMTYQRFKEVAREVVDENLPGWRQVYSL